MHFFKLLAASASLFAGIVSAQNALAISAPAPGAVLQAGQTVTVTWTTDNAKEVQLVLRSGDAANLAVGFAIATVPNTGTYAWTVPADVVDGTNYSIQISDVDGGANSNFSPFFGISGGTGVAKPSVVSSAALSAASSAAVSSAVSSATSAASSGAVPTLTSAKSMTTKAATTATGAAATGASASASTKGSATSSNMAMATMPGSIAAVVGLGALVMLA